MEQRVKDFLFEHEGRHFENDVRDPGGATKFGVDFRSLKEFDVKFLNSIGVITPVTVNSVRCLTETQAEAIYNREYLLPVRNLGLGKLSEWAMFDFSVNAGMRQAVKCLQRYVGVDPDGLYGRKTREAARMYSDYDLAMGIMSKRREFYNSCKPSLKAVFLKGWLQRCVDLTHALDKYSDELDEERRDGTDME